jgi:hypothetical protein
VACGVALVAGAVVAAERSAGAMARAAVAFLDILSPDQRQKATFPFESDERLRWNFIPTEMFPRKGLAIKEMNQVQRQRAHDLLKAGLSQKGYLTASAIMDLEAILADIEERNRQGASPTQEDRARLRRDPELYFFTVFGTPSTKGTWGWRAEGHHVSLHFNIVNGTLVASAPTMFGSNPAEVREGPKKGLRILGDQEDEAYALLTSLDESQRAKAIINNVALRDIVTRNEVQVSPLSPVGLTADAMTPKQRETLMKLVDVYISKMASDIAAERTDRIRTAGVEKIAFAWAGELERGKQHYYRVQGPTFLIELDNTQNNANHIHSVWRDFEGDFGRDLLKEHLKAVAH